MRADEHDLDRVLDHAAAMVLMPDTSAQDAMLVASSSIAGGFRAFVVDLANESAIDLVGALTTRHDTVIGCRTAGDVPLLEEGLAAGVAFVLDAEDDEAVAKLVRDAGRVWIPKIVSVERAGRHRCEGESWGWFEPGGEASFEQLVEASAARSWLAGPGVAGNRIEEWSEAGARAVVLAEAIYSQKLLEQGDRRAIRDYAAAVHREATLIASAARSRG